MKATKLFTLLALLMVFAVSCIKPDEPNNGGNEPNEPSSNDTIVVTLPIVAIEQVTDITHASAICKGFVLDDGGDELTEIGFCWSAYNIPTVDDNHLAAETFNDSAFSLCVTGLIPNTTYQMCSYAINRGGIGYSNPVVFTTHYEEGVDIPDGAICGVYSVSGSKKVFFSQGNLQYRALYNTWRFAEKQYEVIGANNQNISPDYHGLIDLFGWGTSGWGNSYPYNNSASSQYGFGWSQADHDIAGTKYDWGVYNCVWNGGDQEGLWRTLTHNEWEYLLKSRNTVSGIRYVHAQVNNINGVILLPDNWNTSVFTLNNPNPGTNGGYAYTSNVVDALTWQSVFEPAGVVFLPCAGYREVSSVMYLGTTCNYWSATHYDYQQAYFEDFRDHPNWWDNKYGYRYYGRSVRLVHSIN